MPRIPSDNKTYKLARRALVRARESTRTIAFLPESATIRTPKRDRKAWHRLGMRAAMLAVSIATIPGVV